MNLTRLALKYPAGLGAVLALIAGAGLWSLFTLPTQLFPPIERPSMFINAGWRAASPQEIESQVLEPMEEVLEGLPGLLVMDSRAGQGWAGVGLTFALDTDMDRALVEVVGRLNRMDPLPVDAWGPQINVGGGDAGDTLIYFFVQQLPGRERPWPEAVQVIRDRLIPGIEAIDGVSRVELNDGGASGRRLLIDLDLARLAAAEIAIGEVAAAAARADDVSAGFQSVGRRRYQVRMEGRFAPEELGDLILAWRNGAPVRLGEVAEISVAPPEVEFFGYQNGNPAIGLQIQRESGAQTLQAIDAVKAYMEEANATILAPEGLHANKSFDPSVFIKRAIDLLSNNLLLGVGLAVGVLWLFVRRPRMTLLIAAMIPVSILATLSVLKIADRSLNVISLAGLAFAVGMTLDAAIVVLENIVRLREKGLDGKEAAAKGAAQVTGALIASTATTVAIFLPVLAIKEVEGQLFADLALTIAVAVAMSFLAAITVLPAASERFLKAEKTTNGAASKRLDGLADRIIALTDTPMRRRGLALALFAAPILLAWALFPQLSYLPPVKRDAVDAFFNVPEGMSVDTFKAEIAEPVVQRLQPYMDGEKEPRLINYYLNGWNGGGNLGVRVADMGEVREMERIVREEILVDMADVRAFAAQGNLFGGFGGGGEMISVYIQSRDTDALAVAANRAEELLRARYPDANVWTDPRPESAYPELRFIPNDRRLQEVGWDRRDLGQALRTLVDGVWLGEYFDGEARIPIIMEASGHDTPEAMEGAILFTPEGGITPLSELARAERTVGPSQIYRVERRRTANVQFAAPRGVALKEALDVIKTEIEPQIREVLPADGAIAYGGSADDLERAIVTMGTNFLVAVAILFLLTATLFKSLRDAAFVVVTIPLAAAGGVAALRLLSVFAFQPLDLLTMIGFVILLGLVVNNAILLVARTRQAEDEGLDRKEAVREALRTRLRPIFMSTLTSLLGMAPLVLMPGVGSAIYRGMAAVIVGGMALNAAFTLILIPCLLRLGEGSATLAKRSGAHAGELDLQPAE